MSSTLRYVLFITSLFLVFQGINAQAIATPTGDSGSAYPVFTAAGFGIEGPDNSSSDCVSTPATNAGNHKDFGPHILQVADEQLGRNVFAFVSHIIEDSDRCKIQDRVRIEVKGGPGGSSNPELEHNFGDTSYYRWQFRIDEDFIGSGSFTHLFQSKAEGGDNGGLPTLTLTARRTELELIHIPTDQSGVAVDLAQIPLTGFRGKWVEVYIRQVHTDNGLLEVRINDVATGTPLLNYLNEDIDLWRETDNPTFINRPKWGVYRSRADGLRDETVRFADICASETSGALCPSLLPTATGAPMAVTAALPLDGAANVPLTMPLTWNASDGATEYRVYFGTAVTPALAATVADTAYVATLENGMTYYYQIGAANAEGDTRTEVSSFTTLATADAGGWEVARGHAPPHIEAADFFELNANLELPLGVNEVVPVMDEEGNTAYSWFSGPKEGDNGNYRWRYRQEEGEATTLVMRIAPLTDVNNITYVEFYGLGWRQKIRINRDNARFERTPEDPEFEFPENYWQDGEYHLLRLTFAPTADGNMLTSLYLDEADEPFATGLSDEEKTSNYLDIGRAGSTDYGATFDYLAVNPTGAFAPASDSAPALPADLFTGGGGSNGAPLAVTGLLPLNKATAVPLTMPLTWTASEGATSYNVYLGISDILSLVGDTTGTTFDAVLEAGKLYLYQIGAVNANGETLSEVMEFATLADPDDGSWRIARGHAKPNVEAGELYQLDTNLDAPAALDTVVAIGTDGNTAFGYLSGPKEGDNGNYRWRYRQEADESVTLLLRIAPLADNNNLTYVEFYGLGWRQKIRLNQSTAKFEKTPDDPEFDFPENFWKVDSFRILRFTFEPTADGNMVTRLYLDGEAEPLGEGTSDEAKEGSYLDVGRAGGTDYGAYFDYIAINPTGAFGPADASLPTLPTDLVAPAFIVSTRSARDITSLTLYPNPVYSLLQVPILEGREYTYRIISAMGRVVRTGDFFSGRNVEVEALPSGAYVLQLTDRDGRVSVGRFVKH